MGLDPRNIFSGKRFRNSPEDEPLIQDSDDTNKSCFDFNLDLKEIESYWRQRALDAEVLASNRFQEEVIEFYDAGDMNTSDGLGPSS